MQIQTSIRTTLVATLLALLSLASPACSKTASAPPPASTPDPTPPPQTPAPAPAGPAVTPPSPAPTPAPSLKVADLAWNDLKSIPYDSRRDLFAGLVRLNSQTDTRLAAFTRRRGAMTADADTAAWDFAMKTFGNARAHLRSTSDEMNRATPETWDQYKDKLGRAWDRVRETAAEVEATVSP